MAKISRGWSWNLRFGTVALVMSMPPSLAVSLLQTVRQQMTPVHQEVLCFAFRKTKNCI